MLTLATILTPNAKAEGILMSRPEISHYTETSYLGQTDDVVLSSKLTIDALKLGRARGYGGAILEQDSKSTRDQIYNDNGIAPMLGVRVPLFVQEISAFSEYRYQFRLVNRPESRASSQGDLLMGSYGYRYWTLTNFRRSTSLFQESYGDLIARSKLDWDSVFSVWSKSGARIRLDRTFSFDTYLDLRFKRGSTSEREDNYQSVGPGIRLNMQARSLLAAVSVHQEIGSYTWNPDSISRWKTLLVISGAL